MGKPSRLRTHEPAKRTLYDRDKMPDGLDHDVWHLTLLFEQVGEKYGHAIVGRPIAYTELSNRINASNIRVNFVHWIGIMEDMIHRFWEYELDIYKANYAVNEFCSIDTFSHLLQWVVAERERQLLIDSGERIVQPDREQQPPRRTKEETRALEIINKRYTMAELQDKMEEFRGRE